MKMQLEEIEHPFLLPDANRSVLAVEAVRIYYCHRGRNAYWHIWARHYFPGCMHGSLASAQEFAESQRAQGSVFYVEQLPSLLVSTGQICALITQINAPPADTPHPLKDYSYLALSEKDGWVRRVASNTKLVALGKGEILASVLSSFASDSNFWIVPQPRRDSVIMVSWSGSTSDFEKLDSQKLRCWNSKSIGPNYRLQWREGLTSTRSLAVMNLRELVNAQSNPTVDTDARQNGARGSPSTV